MTAPRQQMFSDGDWADAGSGETASVINPATEEEIAQVTKGDASDVDRAVAAARGAFDTWSQSTPQDRSQALYAFADAIVLSDLVVDAAHVVHPVARLPLRRHARE